MSGIMIILGIGLQERGKKHLWIAISTVGYICVYPPPPHSHHAHVGPTWQ